MPRKRSFIFDSSVVYAGIDTVANSNSINTIAGGDVGKKLKVIEIKPYGTPVNIVTGVLGWVINKNIIITSITAELRAASTLAAAPFGASLVTRIRGSSPPSILSTLTIASGTSSATTIFTTPLFVFSDNNLFVDVTAVGLTRPGLGLRWLITYY